MVAWTPANLSTPARLFVQAKNAVWSGTTLVTPPPNEGSDGGSGTKVGTISKGATSNGISMIRLDAASKTIQYTLPQIISGKLFMLGAFAFTAAVSGGARGFLNCDWANNGGVVFYSAVGSDAYAFQMDPSFNLTPQAGHSGAPADSNTALHSFSFQLGTTNAAYVDGVAQTLSVFDTPDTVRFTNHTWEWGRGQAAPDEPLVGDSPFFLLLDYFPTTTERQQLEGWASWEIKGDGSLLPVGHPYKSAAPTISSGINGNAAITEAGDTVSSAGKLKLQAAAAITEAGDTSASAAQLKIQATAFINEAGDTVSSTAGGVAKVTANLSATEADDAVASTAQLKIKATLAATEAGDTLAASGASIAQRVATLAVTEAGDTLSATGTGPARRTADLSVVEGNDSLAAGGLDLYRRARIVVATPIGRSIRPSPLPRRTVQGGR